MKALHTVRILPNDPYLVWFNNLTPCPDIYHEGYDEERRDPTMHGDCALRAARQTISVAISEYDLYAMCGCPICHRAIRRDPLSAIRVQNAHYFRTAEPERLDDALVIVPDGQSWYGCPNCRTGEHPEPPGAIA